MIGDQVLWQGSVPESHGSTIISMNKHHYWSINEEIGLQEADVGMRMFVKRQGDDPSAIPTLSKTTLNWKLRK